MPQRMLLWLSPTKSLLILVTCLLHVLHNPPHLLPGGYFLPSRSRREREEPISRSLWRAKEVPNLPIIGALLNWQVEHKSKQNYSRYINFPSKITCSSFCPKKKRKYTTQEKGQQGKYDGKFIKKSKYKIEFDEWIVHRSHESQAQRKGRNQGTESSTMWFRKCRFHRIQRELWQI